MKSLFVRFVKNESGATAIEYGLIAALMSVGIILGITTLSGNLSTAFTNLGNTVQNATN
ncbi:pilus assembly protein Flp/PilA [Kaistia soli DSM 19436]|uniref:Pilus assembly protein Flp/PilA n=1 Tax=Kaistia soli DSM 19436 TaxID=1122133 RepID=A0A1M5P286_9HYPH|nr:Flp family type IVb pilin [Kaistia soli]SHG95944.1 pilus assembly protein Flp/PilA [Kaistia soli DSM 19436]SHG95983.1 pilus assembly protein Flp/PilA [Kaistia soli DSM 19436]